MNNKVKALIMTVITFLFAVLGFILLPDNVSIQFDFSGNPTTIVSKTVAVILPVVISLIGTFIVFLEKSNIKKGVLVTIIGYFTAIIDIIINM